MMTGYRFFPAKNIGVDVVVLTCAITKERHAIDMQTWESVFVKKLGVSKNAKMGGLEVPWAILEKLGFRIYADNKRYGNIVWVSA